MKIEQHHDRKWLNALWGRALIPLDEIVAVRTSDDYGGGAVRALLRGGGEPVDIVRDAAGPEWYAAETRWLLAALSGDPEALTTPSPGHRP